MVTIPSSEDRWYFNRLLVRHSSSPPRIRALISDALASSLTSPRREGNTLLGSFAERECEVAISLLERPTRRTDKSFFFAALAGRQGIQERFPTLQPVQYLVVRSSVLGDIALYAGGEAFYEAMQTVAFGVFSHQDNLLVYNPLRPDATMSGTEPSWNSNDYSMPKFLTNRLAELALASIGEIQHA